MIAILTAIAAVGLSDDSDAATGHDIRVFVETSDGVYAETTVEGTHVKDIIETACTQLGLSIEYTDLGAIESVGTMEVPEGEYWNIHQWMPLGVHDWDSVGFDEKSDSQIITGTTYCIHCSGITVVNNVNTYDTPSFKPESDGYIFIRFDAEYDNDSMYIQEAFTTEDRMEGFWLKGHGTNMGEVVIDAMNANEFQVETLVKTDSNGNDLQHWIISLFGIGDVNLGDSSSWSYWSQYMYLNDEWTYNDWTLGYYDPGVYKYIAIVYIVSLNYEEGDEEGDVTDSLPWITSEEEIDALVKSVFVNVDFVVDGEIYHTEKCRIDSPIPAYQIPDAPEKEGKTFAGWGYDGDPIYEAMTLTASYTDITFTVDYNDASGNKLYSETVKYGNSAAYSTVPTMQGEPQYTYTFKGWSADGTTICDLSSIKSDLVLTPVFDAVLKQFSVSFVLDGVVIKSQTVDYSTVLAKSDIPEPTVPEGKYFTGWGSVSKAIISDTVFAGSLLDKTEYIVTYLSPEGDVFQMESVYEGEAAISTAVPAKDSTVDKDFTFKSWIVQGTGEEADLSSVSQDLVLEPVYDESVRQYTVTFILNGETVLQKAYDYNMVIPDGDVPVPEVEEGMLFSGWGDTTSPIIADRILQGSVYTAPDCIVKYYNVDGGLISQETVAYGKAATSIPTAGKASTQQYIFTFKGWSADGETLADLTKVTSNMELSPLFTETLQQYTVFFKTHDGTLIKECKAEYGGSPVDMPADPSRPDTVDKVYTFIGWYKIPYVKFSANDNQKADLDSVKSSITVYAAYTYVKHPYTLTIVTGGESITKDIVYGGFLSEALMMDSMEGFLLKFYREAGLETPLGTSYMFTGDTTLYAEKNPGTYTYSDTSKRTVYISLSASDASSLTKTGNKAVAADISQFASSKSLEIPYATMKALYDGLGGDTEIIVSLPRGSIGADLGGLMGILEESDGESAVFSIEPGTRTSVRLNTSLKGVCADATYKITITVSDRTIVDTVSEGVDVTVYLPYTEDPDENIKSMVWSANTNTGALTPLEHTVSDGIISFDADTLLYFAVGTSAARSTATDDRDWCPYGTVEYTCEGESEANYHSTLDSMDIDNHGETLFIPSALEGYPLWYIGPDAFTGVKDTPAIVIPATVKSLDWNSLNDVAVHDIYFMGDMPEFIGEQPVTLTVHYSDHADGWSDSGCEPLVVASYDKGSTRLQYCLIDEEIVIVKWVQGISSEIPSTINVGGTDYPVTTIGCEAFRGSAVENVKIPATVTAVQTRAFYQCSSLLQVNWESGSSVTVLADECFRACAELRSTNTVIPDTVRFIGFEAFRDCHMLKNVVIPDSVTDMRDGAFYNCTQLSNVKIGSGITTISKRCFGYCNDLSGVEIPDKVTAIGYMAFYNCTMLDSLDLNNTETVGTSALANCKTLKTVTLGASLKLVGSNCFAGCQMLTEVTAYCEEPEGLENSGITENTTVLVNYDVADKWSYEHEVIEKEDDLKESFESRTMPYIIGGLIVAFVAIGIIAVRFRTKT